MYMGLYVSMPHMRVVPAEARKDFRSSGTGVTDSCELLSGCWELNHGPLEEQASVLNRWAVSPASWKLFMF